MVSIVQPSKEPSVKQKAHSTNDNQQMAQINNETPLRHHDVHLTSFL